MELKTEKPIVSSDPDLLISREDYVVSFARGQNGNHVILILEGLDETDTHKAWQLDLIIEKGDSNKLDQSLPEKYVGSNATSSLFKKVVGELPLPLQKADIRIFAITEPDQWDHLNAVADEFIYQTFGINRKQADKLLQDAKDDQFANIYYNYSGDGSAHSISFSGQKHHSCVSWAKHRLKDIGIPVVEKSYNWIVVIPSKELPERNQRI